MGARDEVAVEVHDGLACRLAAIHPHVVAVRLVALLDPGFRRVQNRRQRPCSSGVRLNQSGHERLEKLRQQFFKK